MARVSEEASAAFGRLRVETRPLEEGRFPEHTGDPTDPDHVFTKYQGELSEPLPMLEQVTSRIFNPDSGAETAADINLKGD